MGMNFTEAARKLSDMNPDRYHSTKMEIIKRADGLVVAECTLYVDGRNHHSGATWELAFESLAYGSRTAEEIEQMAA